MSCVTEQHRSGYTGVAGELADSLTTPETDSPGVSEDLLYGGETTVAQLSIPDGRLIATTHRLLVVTPNTDGANLRTAHRANVQRLGRATNGRQFLRPTVYAFGGGVAGMALGSAFSLDGLGETVPSDGPAAGVLGPLGTALELASLLDELLIALGAVCLLVGTIIATVWLLVRQSVVVVRVAGRETIRVPAGSLDATRVERFSTDAGFEFDDGPL